MLFEINMAGFSGRYKKRVVFEITIFLCLLITFQYVDIAYALKMLIIGGGLLYIIIDILLYKSTKNHVEDYVMRFEGDALFFSRTNSARKVYYQDIEIKGRKKKKGKVIEIKIKTPEVSNLKIKNFINMDKLYLTLKSKI